MKAFNHSSFSSIRELTQTHLEITLPASSEDIKDAYKKLSKKKHSDVPGGMSCNCEYECCGRPILMSAC